ncbi:MAG: hypothetical protein RIM84_22510 [Alphaproteobacteria bacterium]
MLIRYALGSVLGLLVVWLLTAVLLPGAPPWIYDEVMETANLAPGHVRYVGEDFGHIEQASALGFDLDGIDLGRDKVLIWGDSQVHALSLETGERLHTQLEERRRESRIDYTAVSLGRGGYSVADWHHRMPIGERVYAPVAAHIILISAVHDLLPGGEGERNDRLVDGQPPRFIQAKATEHRAHAASLNSLAPAWVRQAGLYPIFRELWVGRPLVTGYLRPSHWLARLREVQSAAPAPAGDGDRPRFSVANAHDIWRWVLPALRARTALPVVLVYAPRVPRLAGGRLLTDDPHAPWVAALREVAAANGIGIVDMRERFRRFYASERRFPRGYATSRPDAGHINAAGMSLIAEAIAEAYPSRASYGAAPE